MPNCAANAPTLGKIYVDGRADSATCGFVIRVQRCVMANITVPNGIRVRGRGYHDIRLGVDRRYIEAWPPSPGEDIREEIETTELVLVATRITL